MNRRSLRSTKQGVTGRPKARQGFLGLGWGLRLNARPNAQTPPSRPSQGPLEVPKALQMGNKTSNSIPEFKPQITTQQITIPTEHDATRRDAKVGSEHVRLRNSLLGWCSGAPTPLRFRKPPPSPRGLAEPSLRPSKIISPTLLFFLLCFPFSFSSFLSLSSTFLPSLPPFHRF